MTLNYQPKGLSQTSITDLTNLILLKIKRAEIARANNDIDASMFYERQAEELEFIVDFIVSNEIKEITNHALPMRGLRALTFDSTRIVEMVDTQKKIEFDFKKATTQDQKVTIVLNNPALRAERNTFGRRIIEEAKEHNISEGDLLTSNDNSIKLIRSQILSYLGNGRRQDAITFITEKVLKHKECTPYGAHRLINDLKAKFAVKEPRLTLDFTIDDKDVKNYRPIPMGEWIFARYKTGAFKRKVSGLGRASSDKVELSFPEEAYGYIRIEPYAVNDMMHNFHGQPLCRIQKITRWRLATKYEIKNVIPETKLVDFDK